jgi:hypothetical protein
MATGKRIRVHNHTRLLVCDGSYNPNVLGVVPGEGVGVGKGFGGKWMGVGVGVGTGAGVGDGVGDGSGDGDGVGVGVGLGMTIGVSSTFPMHLSVIVVGSFSPVQQSCHGSVVTPLVYLAPNPH